VAIVLAVKPFRLAHISDPHFGAHDEALVEALPGALASLSLDATIITGDFTMAGRRSEFRRAREWIERIPEPRVVMPGNHDIPKFNHFIDRLFRPFRRYRNYIDPEVDHFLNARGVCLKALNSSRPFGLNWDWSGGRLSLKQIRLIKESFEKAPDGAFRIVALHHPTVAQPENRRELVGRLDALKEALAQAQVDLVLGGHFHQSYVMSLECGSPDHASVWNTTVSQVSTVTSTRLQGEPNGFHVINLSDGYLQAERYIWAGIRYEHEETFVFRRDPEVGWRPLTAEERPPES